MLAIVDKPSGISSFGAIKALKKLFPGQKVGHSGTLDPNATGLMILGIGKDTKKLTELTGLDKTYLATIDFSKTSDTRDIQYHEMYFEYETYSDEGLVTSEKLTDNKLDHEVTQSTHKVAQSNIKLGETSCKLSGTLGNKCSNNFIGLIINGEKIPAPSLDEIKSKLDQLVPSFDLPLPSFSAKKINGKRFYKMARKGEMIERYQIMRVHDYQILEYNFPILKISINVGSGTYIRSIAYRLGNLFGLGGILTELRRQIIGKYNLDDYEFKTLENSQIKYHFIDSL